MQKHVSADKDEADFDKREIMWSKIDLLIYWKLYEEGWEKF